MYTDDLIYLVLCWLFYYLIVFVEITIGVLISLRILERKSSINLDKKKRLAVLGNMFISFLVGYIVALIFTTVKESNFILIVLFVFSLAVVFPISYRDPFTIALIIAFILGMMIFSIFLNYIFFSKKVCCSKKQSIISALLIAVMSAPYFMFVSFQGLI